MTKVSHLFWLNSQSILQNHLLQVSDFANRIRNFESYFKTNHIIVPMGGDFQYQAAEINFENSDKLIKYDLSKLDAWSCLLCDIFRAFQNDEQIKLLYSTPSCYLKAVYESQPKLQVKTDDFFPYGSADHSYWAGYFTSRPNYKRLERITLNTLQV